MTSDLTLKFCYHLEARQARQKKIMPPEEKNIIPISPQTAILVISGLILIPLLLSGFFFQ